MIAAWMAFAVMSGGALTVAALAAERAAAAAGGARRWVWAAALAATAAWPLAAWVAAWQRVDRGPAEPAAAASAWGVLPAFAVTGTALTTPAVDRALLGAWAIASAALLARFGLGALVLRGARRRWPARVVDGVPVRVSGDVGPAVVGLRRPDVVLPIWALALDPAERALVLRHETEHRRARDPYALALAALVPVLLPWHPAVWWQARRLRLAVEVDCDARVLRGDPRPAAYARLLVLVAQRRGAGAPWLAPAAPALVAPASHLERRLHAMRTLPSHPARLAPRALAFGAAALAAAAAACAVEPPASPTATPAVRAGVSPAATAPVAPGTSTTRAFRDFQLSQQASPRTSPNFGYPAEFKAAKIGGRVLVQFVVDTAGRVEPASVRVRQATHPAFAAAVQARIGDWQFTPARVEGHAVRQLVELPITFDPNPSETR